MSAIRICIIYKYISNDFEDNGDRFRGYGLTIELIDIEGSRREILEKEYNH